jgi:protein AbiQ
MPLLIPGKYFRDKRDFVEMLDSGDVNKQSSRSYLRVSAEHNGFVFFVPLRKKINFCDKRMGYSLPSETRADAGLDFRKALIVNENEYFLSPKQGRVSPLQTKKIESERARIEYLFFNYVNGYVKAARKKREKIDTLYKFSTLHNFHAELGV